MIALNEKLIRENIQSTLSSMRSQASIDESKLMSIQPLTIHLFDSIDSTNCFLKKLKPTAGISICCAETQTNGKGRLGRSWHSPYGENIYFSARFPIKNYDFDKLSGVSLVTSLAVIETLKVLNLNHEVTARSISTSRGLSGGSSDEAGSLDSADYPANKSWGRNVGADKEHEQLRHDLTIKWPNDILWKNKKLSGCLVELIMDANIPSEIIVGIGINVNSKALEHPLPDKEWCSLLDITGNHHDRNTIIGSLVNYLSLYLDQLGTQGFQSFANQWQAVDYLKGSKISLTQPIGFLNGVAQGVTESGHLILIDELGITHVISSGDASLKNC